MWEMSALERRYSVPPSTLSDPSGRYRTTEDLHAWSIYRQNLNADFTDSALGTGGDKNQPPFGNFQLRESTVHTILNHPKYGPRERNSELASNVYTYLRFGLPRVFPHGLRQLPRDTSSGYDSSDDGVNGHRVPGSPFSSKRKTRSDPDFRNHIIPQHREREEVTPYPGVETSFARLERQRLKASSEADLINNDVLSRGSAGSGHHMSRAPSSSHLSAINGGFRSGSTLGLNRVHLTPDGYNSNPMPSVGGGSHGSVMNGGVNDRRSNMGSKAGSKTGSKAGSNISLNSRASRQRSNYRAESVINNKLDGFQITDGPLLNDKFFPKDSFYNALPGGDSEVGIATGIKHHPHLQVRDLSFEMDMSSAWKRLCGGARTKLRLLEGLNFEARGGEILAIMATSEMEGTGLLDILANRHRKWRSRLLGEIVVNGLYMSPAKMESCVSYVQKEAEFFLDMSVRQTLLFTTLLREPGNGQSFDTKGRINALLEDLGLGQVKHTRVRDLTESEKRRLNVACHLLMDTDIVLLDQPTKGMDIFDTFFLMEYLRQWAARGRIVVVTIHPPTYEIFTMISRIALISTGRMLYFGKRRDMLPYFAYIDFPCPAYKNPSDYYRNEKVHHVDLVTLDNLSSEAMLESSQRVENLVDIFRRRQEALSDPGPPGQPPSGFKTANFFTQILALWIRVLIYMFPFNIIGFVGDAILAAMMSVLVGAIFWNVRLGREQEHVNDKFGFYYALMAIAVWPFLLRIVAKVWREKSIVYKDIREGLYGKAAYLFSKAVYSLPVSAALIVAYVVPAYSMAGLESSSSSAQVRSYGIYIGYMLLYMFCLRAVACTSAWLCSSRHLAAVLAGFVLTIVFLSSGYAVHLKDLSLILFWTQWVSPARWIGEQLMNYEFHERYEYIFEGEGKYYCSHNPVVQQDTAILVRAECGIKQDPDALKYFGFRDDWSTWQPLVITFAFLLTSMAIGWGSFILSTPAARKKRPIRGRFAKI